jgi:ABC-type Fe3+ transport system substrate-binding protein
MVIWPEDGALIMPMYLLAKAEPKRDLKPFLDFVLGERYGQKSADNGYPVLNPAVDNKLPDNAGFKWLGWDYIRSYSMEELYKRVMEIFNGAWRKGAL